MGREAMGCSVPDAVRKRAKLALLDTMGVMLAGVITKARLVPSCGLGKGA